MKLLIITAVHAYEEKVKKILADNRILSYSYTGVTGYRDSTQDEVSSNWFGTEMNKVESLMFFAFVPEPAAEQVFSEIEKINGEADLRSRIHVTIAPIDKHN